MYRFEKLTVWQEATVLVEICYRVIKKLPDSEKFGLIDQLRRAAVSIVLNIAEGSGSHTDKEFLRYLYLAKKSLFEVITILKLIEKIYPEIELIPVYTQTDKVSKLLSGLITKLKAKS